MDRSKEDAVLQWEIQNFMGLVGYYKRFIEVFSRLALPLTKLTRKGQTFLWKAQCEESFKYLKKRLVSALVLIFPSSREYLVVYYNASKLGLCGVLMQKCQVVTYAFRQLNTHEKNYPIYDLGLAAVFFMLKIWRHYLYGSIFEVFSDHNSLKYLFDKKELNMRQRKRLEFLKDYDCN
ncbi:hypothetical protein KIW84_035543 [Lathyrus oleraceus]|uniref:Reverse transcriptase RNase H-like domain-containing protein n=1 Tax=Pisum sativum TaxID=3888 RepID=A0A9D4Y1U8_PEA|nr:hypothetical protein KIW84_035543 [Pisum sativum]